MARWGDLETEAPELAARIRARLDAHVHKTIATLRRDGAPRISGIECFFVDGDLWFGSMRDAVKAKDLQRDPRFALHSGSDDPPAWKGDAKLAGRAEEITDLERMTAVYIAGGHEQISPSASHLFRAELAEVSIVWLGEPADHLVIESWHEGRGVSRLRRA